LGGVFLSQEETGLFLLRGCWGGFVFPFPRDRGVKGGFFVGFFVGVGVSVEVVSFLLGRKGGELVPCGFFGWNSGGATL